MASANSRRGNFGLSRQHLEEPGTDDAGSIAIIGWQFDDGGSGLTSIDNVTIDENKGSSVAAALGGLVVGNLTSDDGSSFSARCNAGRTDNWSGVVAVLE